MWTSATYISFCTNVIEQFQIYIQALQVSEELSGLTYSDKRYLGGLNWQRLYGSYVKSLNALFWGGGEKWVKKKTVFFSRTKSFQKVKFFLTQNEFFFQIKKWR